MIYEYRCQDCEEQFEVWAKVSDPAPDACPKCSSSNLEKVIFATNFALKGGGWYAQGYGNSSTSKTKEGASTGSENNKSVNKDSGTKSESKN